MHLPARRLRLSRVAAATAATVALAVGLTACGSDDAGSRTAETSAVTGSAAPTGAAGDGHDHDHGEPADAPTAESLQAGLDTFVNPDVPVDDKVALVVDGEQRRDLFEQLNAALQTYRGITFQVAGIEVDGDTATADTTITSPRGYSAPPDEFTWQHEDDSWKLSDADACVLFGFAQIPCKAA
ncbi:hypothetical protein [Nocardia sp. NPDC003345]